MSILSLIYVVLYACFLLLYIYVLQSISFSEFAVSLRAETKTLSFGATVLPLIYHLRWTDGLLGNAIIRFETKLNYQRTLFYSNLLLL